MAQIMEYIKIALMNIKGNKGRSFLTMLGIIIGISSVIMIISIGEGIKGGVNNELSAIADGRIYIYTNSENEDGTWIEFTEEDITAIEETVPNVKAVTSQVTMQGNAATRKGDFTAMISFGTVGMQYMTSDPMVKGRYFNESEYWGAQKVCVLTESSARMLFGTTDVVGMEFELDLHGRADEYRIVGIRQDSTSVLSGLMISDTVALEVPYTLLSESYGLYGIALYDLYVICDGGEHAAQVAKDSARLLENRYNVRGQNVIQVENFNDYLGEMNEIISMITTFIVFVAAISLLVGGIGVMNIMLVSVTERTREIGIRKALGARTGSILFQFLCESAIITLLGGIIGILLGVMGASLVCSFMGFTATISPGTVAGASLFSAAVGIFFGIYPARRAAKLSPIEALRHE
ncbi:MAG: ABC transporter permease [Lachnospiraceae bacterium]|nr:ABC transporter permease [Lachnospiraceae bacterium]